MTLAPSSGGGSFTIRHFPDEAPATVARVLRLVREAFYDGKVFQRVEPNFVVQGGGPDANDLRPRPRYRGRPVVPQPGGQSPARPRVTLFGRLDGGRAVAERVLEGDRIARVVVLDDETD